MKNEIVLFRSQDGAVSLPVSVEADTVWLTQAQMGSCLAARNLLLRGTSRTHLMKVKSTEMRLMQKLHI